jgi:hypothetical protein
MNSVTKNNPKFRSQRQRRAAWTFLALSAIYCAACSNPVPTQSAFYRFDDHLESASVSAPNISSSAGLTEPVVWRFDSGKTDWKRIRGGLDFQEGFLILKGRGGSPVISSPENQPIDWSGYESILIRMGAEGGSTTQIKIGEWEKALKLGPPKEFRVYRFDLDFNAPVYSRPLNIMPTDSPNHVVAIEYIELVPRKSLFPEAVGRLTVGKRELARAGPANARHAWESNGDQRAILTRKTHARRCPRIHR